MAKPHVLRINFERGYMLIGKDYIESYTSDGRLLWYSDDETLIGFPKDSPLLSDQADVVGLLRRGTAVSCSFEEEEIQNEAN